MRCKDSLVLLVAGCAAMTAGAWLAGVGQDWTKHADPPYDQLAKSGDRWWIQDAKRSELQPHP